METKATIRQYYRTFRRHIPAEKKLLASCSLADIFLNASRDKSQKNIAVYLAVDGEINLQPLIKALWQLQYNVFLPVIDIDTQMLSFVQYNASTTMKKNQYGIEEPQNMTSDILAKNLDFVLMPLVAFDHLGTRLGMGKGFYDKSFEFCREKPGKPLLIGVAYACQCAQQLPVDPWDVPLDGVLTEKELLIFSVKS
ncbi:MAG: 5-formyltetrahydrofolate cyclo-ligase [Gammaproteobacteria bacterium]|nr:5-formyltetrahydrofolate cyclo-ligase [Gammaproteobacteria bacterium]